MSFASALRLRVENALANRIPSALTPQPKVIRPVIPTGISAVDEVLEGGLPAGAITELVGPESSGRSGLALSFVSRVTAAGRVGAWVDVCDALCPESAAEAGTDLSRLLWVRCKGIPANRQLDTEYKFALPDQYMVAAPAQKGLHGGGHGGHPRSEVRGMSQAVHGLLQPETVATRRAETRSNASPAQESFTPHASTCALKSNSHASPAKPWSCIDKALRVTDLLLQTGGFSAIVLDMASIAPEFVSRIPLSTWFRYRAAAERTQASLLLLTQYPCAKSSCELLLRFHPGKFLRDDKTVFTGLKHSLEVQRRRFAQTSTNISLHDKAPRTGNSADWHSQPAWVSVR